MGAPQAGLLAAMSGGLAGAAVALARPGAVLGVAVIVACAVTVAVGVAMRLRTGQPLGRIAVYAFAFALLTWPLAFLVFLVVLAGRPLGD